MPNNFEMIIGLICGAFVSVAGILISILYIFPDWFEEVILPFIPVILKVLIGAFGIFYFLMLIFSIIGIVAGIYDSYKELKEN